MKKLSDFLYCKMSIKQLNAIVGGESYCTHYDETSIGGVADLRSTKFNDEGVEVSSGSIIIAEEQECPDL